MSSRIASDDDELETAREFARESFASAVGTHDMPIVAAVGVTLAQLTAAAGDPAEAAVMLGAAARVRGADDPTACEIVRLRRELIAALGEACFADLYATGRALDRAAAIERLSPP
jgi:hypothetical protein